MSHVNQISNRPSERFLTHEKWQVEKISQFQSLLQFSILCDDFINFLGNRDKEFKLGPMHFHLETT